MNTDEFIRRTLLVVFVVSSFIGAFLLFFRIYPTILLAFTCWVIAIALNIIVNNLQARGVKRVVAIGLTIGLVLSVATLFSLLVVPSFVREVGDIVRQLPDTAEEAVRNYASFRTNNIPAQQLLPAIDPGNFAQTLEDLLGASDTAGTAAPLDIAGLLGSATSALVTVGSVLGNAVLQFVLVVLITLFLIIDPTFFERLILGVVPPRSEARTIDILNEVRQTVRQWVGAMFISIIVTSILYWIVLGLILGLPNALALSVVGGVATIVPTIGPTIAIIPVIIFALAEGLPKLVAAVILYAAVGIVQDRIVTPAVMKSELNIPPAGLVLFQLVAAALLGFVGVLIAVPLLAVLSTLVREILMKDILGKSSDGVQIHERHGKIVRIKPKDTASG